MLINLLSRDNGVGLSTDMELLGGLLAGRGHRVARVDWQAVSQPRCDVVVFLELFNPRALTLARRSVGVFNLEWFPRRWVRYLQLLDQLWAKSREAEEIYLGQGLGNAVRTGFLARDLRDPAVEREPRVLHLQGHSKLKNTDAVLEAWARWPDLPPLTIVTMQSLRAVPPGVTVLSHLPRERLVEEVNRHQIHLCPSRAEGWGHYIVEAMAAEAVVVATNASPMNEHVQPDRGLLIPSTAVESSYLAPFHDVAAEDIAEAVREAAEMSAEERAQIGKAAREHVLTGNDRFAETIDACLGRL